MKYSDENELIKIIKMYFSDTIAASSKITDSCLLINGINIHTKEPLRWFMEDDTKPIMSSITRQIHLLKAFKLFSAVTGENFFVERYYDILKLYFSNYQNPNGLINWGGHVFIDLETMKPTGPVNKKMRHELKNTFPDYDTMHQVNPEATLKFIRSFWGSHISDKDSLVITRHGFIDDDIDFDFSTYQPSKMNSIISSSLTFLNSANDLVYAALKYYKYTKDINAVRVSEQLLNK